MKTYLYDIRRTDGQETRVIIDEVSAKSLYEQLAADLGSKEPEADEWRFASEIPDGVTVIGKNTGVKFRREDGKTYFLGTNKTWLLSESFFLDEELAKDGGFVRVGRA